MDDPGNYRGITLLSCISKVFTSAISRRLYKFVENFDILGSEQAGFRKGHSTVDHISLYCMHCLKYMLKREKVNCIVGLSTTAKRLALYLAFTYGPSCCHKILMAKFLMSSEICILLQNPLLEAIIERVYCSLDKFS